MTTAVPRSLHVDDIRSGLASIDAKGHIHLKSSGKTKAKGARKPTRALLRALAYDRLPRNSCPMDVTVQNVRTCSETNDRDSPVGTWRRRQRQQVAVFGTLGSLHRRTLPVVVTLTRIAERTVDRHAEWHKAVVDEVARWLGADDDDPRIEWKFKQAPTRQRGEWAVRIEVQPVLPSEGT